MISWVLLLLILPWFATRLYVQFLRHTNHFRRSAVLKELGRSPADTKTRLVGYFHPYCNAGGGGERVLWVAVAASQRADPDVIHVVYSGDVDASKEEIISKAKLRFNIDLDPAKLHFVFLNSRHLVEDSAWPRFTLLGQSAGSMILAWEALTKLMPDLYIDTMGYAFTFHVVSFLTSIPIGAYVHYPTISTDMLARVRSRRQWHTNDDAISSSAVLSWGKLLYYRLFMYYYYLSLRRAHFLMVNSTWTKNHVDSILEYSDLLLTMAHSIIPPFWFITSSSASVKTRTVYPPCNTQDLTGFELDDREPIILSVAQFRPEKDHAAQLKAFHKFIEKYASFVKDSQKPVRLVLIGGCRNEGDRSRLEGLQKLARELKIDEYVEFIVNAPFSTILSSLSKASIGLSTMVDEHFGINVVEFMAAGVIPVAHASGGPLLDIVVPWKGEATGYHATDAESFADAIYRVLSLQKGEELAHRERARKIAVTKFSEAEFEKGWNASGWRDYL